MKLHCGFGILFKYWILVSFSVYLIIYITSNNGSIVNWEKCDRKLLCLTYLVGFLAKDRMKHLPNTKDELILKQDVQFTAVNLSSSDAGDSGIKKC
jgi:hypothetical protein